MVVAQIKEGFGWVTYIEDEDESTVFLELQAPWDMAYNQISGFESLRARVTKDEKVIWEGIFGIDPLPGDLAHGDGDER